MESESTSGNSPAALLSAALAERYRIERELGQGGMATVYLAEDLKHHRKVALKVLRPELGATMGPERFAREIEVAARLLHPHILGLLDSGEAAGFFYYVMPYVEGETLRERLARSGELPVPEAVRLLSEIAEALAVAHRAGVVHRDIKPENILLSGRHAMVMDFGVAKAVTEASGRQQLTTAGIALGTPAYMSPEQATADPQLDGRVDIYALGIVGYEMLTGRTPFFGLSPQQTLAAHVTQAPKAVGETRPNLSPALAALIMRCLAKRPADRYQSADELVAVLEPLATPSGGMTPTETRPHMAVAGSAARGNRQVAAWVAATLVVIVAAFLAFRSGGSPIVAIGSTSRLTSAPGLEILPAISPDGKFLAYTAPSRTGTSTQIYIQPIDGGRPLAVTDSVPGSQTAPDWSPDGGKLVFASFMHEERSIIVMPPTGGAARIVFRSRSAHGRQKLSPRWSPDGRLIAFAEGDSLLIIGQDGAGLRLVARATDVHSAAWSPDGRWLAAVKNNDNFVHGTSDFGNLAASTIFIVPAAGGTPRMVTDSTTLNISPVWLGDGRGLLFVSNGGGGRDIYQLGVDRSGRPVGAPRRITTGLDAHTIALSHDGRRLAYAKYTRDVNLWMLRVPPAGRGSVRDAVQITRGNQTIESMRLSPDGRWVAYDSDLNGNADIFVVSAEGGTPRQLTDDRADDMAPDWSPDGRQIAFHSFRTGKRDVFTMNADGTGVERITSDSAHDRYAVWGSNDALAYAKDSAAVGAVMEVRRANGSAPWGPPKWIATGVHISGATSDHGYLVDDVGTDSSFSRVIPSGGGPARVIPLPKGVLYAILAIQPRGSRAIYFFSEDSAGSYIGAADVARGTTRKVITFDAPGRRRTLGVFDTDGSRFYFTFGEHEADIWVADVELR